jgi:hypothetical protein
VETLEEQEAEEEEEGEEEEELEEQAEEQEEEEEEEEEEVEQMEEEEGEEEGEEELEELEEQGEEGEEEALTVAGLEVPVYDGHDGLAVEVQHATGDLHGPVHQRARRDALPGQRAVQGAAAGELHHQAEVGLLQAHPQQAHDVGVLQHGEELGLLPHALQRLAGVLVRVPAGRLHRHLLAAPHSPVHLPEAPHPDDLLQGQLREAIRDMVLRCPQTLFIFDEAEKLHPGLIDAIKPYLDHYDNVDGVSYRRAVFLFLRLDQRLLRYCTVLFPALNVLAVRHSVMLAVSLSVDESQINIIYTYYIYIYIFLEYDALA